MFLEPQYRNQRAGWIEVICGSMFSGKTEELIRRVKRAQIANQETIIFKPTKDKRYSDDEVVSHSEQKIPSKPIQSPLEMLDVPKEVKVIGIDEAQFFDESIVEVCNRLVMQGKRIVIAGLDLDYLGNPFGPMPRLMAIAEYVTKVHAICVHCGALAQHSYRKINDKDQVVLGATEAYEPRCRVCFHMGNILDLKN